MPAKLAVVVGGGIGGLAAAVALRRRGWDVTVLERRPEFAEVGAGLSLMANALRGLDALGLANAVRDAGQVDAPGGTRTSSGRWLARIDGEAMNRVLGTAVIGIHRAALHQILRDTLPASTLVTNAEVTNVELGPPTTVDYEHGGVRSTLHADLVVGADGLGSAVRSRLWPAHPRPVYSGTTAWRAVTRQPWEGERISALSWGPGAEFGMLPLLDGRVYWYGAVNSPPGLRCADELAAVRERFGSWHAPVAGLLAATDPGAVLRNDIYCLDAPLPSFVRGRVAVLGDAAHAMTPNLGQGACQAIEDAVVLGAVCGTDDDLAAALTSYDAMRRPRAQGVARAARRIGRFGQQLSNPVAVGLRNAVIRLVPAGVAMRSMSRYADWSPPNVT